MIKKFLYLEWKSFVRSASFAKSLGLKILMAFGALYFAVIFLVMGVGAFYIIKKELKLDPFETVNQFLIYYFAMDFVLRNIWQKIPVLNIKPLLSMNVTSNDIVSFSLGKTAVSYFNWVHALFFIPFTVVLLIEGYNPVGVILWHLGIVSLIYCSNFLNVYLSNKDNLYNVFLGVLVVLAASQYFNLFDITVYTKPFFQGLYTTQWVFLIPVLVLLVLIKITFDFFKSNLYLDAGLKIKGEVAVTENLTWLNQFGTLGTFLKNDIKLIKRNKRSKTTIGMSVLFLFYGLLFFSGGIKAYDNPLMHVFAGVFVSGGFLLTFGQFVPSWDSAYYPLMMTQNIPYRNYLSSKWWLMVIGTAIATVLASFYLYFGIHIYLIIVAGAIFNIGVNSYLVLWGGAYTKTPIDLASSRGAYGDKKAFNIKTLLISLPQLLLPMALYGLGLFIYDKNLGIALVALAGIIGFALRNTMFTIIEKTYKKEKYKALEAYKQKMA
jgi:hypothetical protein